MLDPRTTEQTNGLADFIEALYLWKHPTPIRNQQTLKKAVREVQREDARSSWCLPSILTERRSLFRNLPYSFTFMMSCALVVVKFTRQAILRFRKDWPQTCQDCCRSCILVKVQIALMTIQIKADHNYRVLQAEVIDEVPHAPGLLARRVECEAIWKATLAAGLSRASQHLLYYYVICRHSF